MLCNGQNLEHNWVASMNQIDKSAYKSTRHSWVLATNSVSPSQTLTFQNTIVLHASYSYLGYSKIPRLEIAWIATNLVYTAPTQACTDQLGCLPVFPPKWLLLQEVFQEVLKGAFQQAVHK